MEKSVEKLIFIKDFSKNPGPRYINQGKSSGEDYYLRVLNKEFTDAYEKKYKLIVNLDGVDGYMSSFLDEAFGNLVYDFGIDNVTELLSVVSNEEPEWIDMIENDTYVEWQKRRDKNDPPKRTNSFSEWSQLNEGKIVTIKIDR